MGWHRAGTRRLTRTFGPTHFPDRPMSNAPLRIGLTGGIGSGKTTAAALFERDGYPVYLADERAKALMQDDPDLCAKIQKRFGEAAYTAEGELNRAFLSEHVFNDKRKLAALNALVHPAVLQDTERWYERVRAETDKAFVLKEAAILYEAGTAKQLDGVILLSAPKELRIRRVIAREDSTREDVLARMSRQWPDANKRQLADFLVFNDGVHALEPQVAAAEAFFHQQLARGA